MEDYGSLCPAEAGQGSGSGIEAETSLHPHIVRTILSLVYLVISSDVFNPFCSNKPHPAAIGPPLPHSSKNGAHKIEIGLGPGKVCECCSVATSVQWYAWGTPAGLPVTQAPSRLCQNCWNYWKKYGDLTVSNKSGGAALSSSSMEEDPKNFSGGADSQSSRPHRCATQGCGKVKFVLYLILIEN